MLSYKSTSVPNYVLFFTFFMLARVDALIGVRGWGFERSLNQHYLWQLEYGCTLITFYIGRHRKYVMFVSANRQPILARKIRIGRLVKTLDFLSRAEPSDILLKIKKCHPKCCSFRATVKKSPACFKWFERLKVMNCQSKVSEINDFGKPDKKSIVRHTLKACLGRERNIFPMPTTYVLCFQLYTLLEISSQNLPPNRVIATRLSGITRPSIKGPSIKYVRPKSAIFTPTLPTTLPSRRTVRRNF